MRTRIPADIDMADRILGRFTARQLALLACDAFALWGLWFVFGRHLPLVAFGILAAPLAAVGVVCATTTIEGSNVERFLVDAFRFMRVPRKRVLAPEGIASVPLGINADRVVPVEFGVEAIETSGEITVGGGDKVLILRSSSVNFALRSEHERRALVEGFGRVLNSLDAPLQIVVRSERTDVRAAVDALQQSAGDLAHPALEASAREHATFLTELGARRDILTHTVFLCLRGLDGSDLERRSDELAGQLRGLGLSLQRLDGDEVATVIQRATDPEAPPPPAPQSPPAEVVKASW